MDPLFLSRSLVIGDGAVAVTVAAVEARHTHSTLHMMRGGDVRLLSRVTAVDNMAVVSISSRRGCFAFFLVCLVRAPRRALRIAIGQSRAIRMSQCSIRDSRELYQRPLHWIQKKEHSLNVGVVNYNQSIHWHANRKQYNNFLKFWIPRSLFTSNNSTHQCALLYYEYESYFLYLVF